MDWYLGVLKKYAVFGGRAHRTEFWMFVLINLIVTVILGFIDGMLGLADEDSGYGLFSGVYLLAVLLPSIAVAVRRLHDTGRSGWWLLIGFVPLVGFIVLLVFYVLESQPGTNEYGPNPKDGPAAVPV